MKEAQDAPRGQELANYFVGKLQSSKGLLSYSFYLSMRGLVGLAMFTGKINDTVGTGALKKMLKIYQQKNKLE